MIELNLLQKRSSVYYQKIILLRIALIYCGGLILILLVAGIHFLANRILIDNYQREIAKLNKQMTQPEALNLETYKTRLQTLTRQIAASETELANRTSWSQRVALIANAVPAGMRLTRLSSTTDPQTGTRTFVIEGFVSASETGAKAALSAFMDRLYKTGAAVLGKITLARLARTRVNGGGSVIAFKVNCETANPGLKK